MISAGLGWAVSRCVPEWGLSGVSGLSIEVTPAAIGARRWAAKAWLIRHEVVPTLAKSAGGGHELRHVN